MSETHYPYAAKGLKLLFWTRLLGLLVPIALGLILALVQISMDSQSPVFSLLSEFLPMLVFGCLELLALYLARRDHRRYALALLLSFLGLLLAVAQPSLPEIFLLPDSQSLSVWDGLGTLLEMGVYCCVCTATAQLLRQLGQEKLAKLGNVIWICLLGLNLFAMIMPFFVVFSSSQLLSFLGSVVVVALGGFALWVLYLYFLWKSAAVLT